MALSIKTNSDKQKLKDIYTLVGERDIQSYKLTLLELEERINRLKEETRLLYQYHLEIKKFEHNYDMLSNSQKYALGMSINLLESSVQLLINPLLGLQSNVLPEYFRKFVLLEDANNFGGLSIDEIYSHPDLMIYLANLLYDINLNEQDIKDFWKNLISNKENQENFNIISFVNLS